MKRASIIAASHQRGHRQTALFIGPTGSGKTEIWRVLQGEVPHIKIIDGSQLCASNYKGDLHIRDIFMDTVSKAEAERLLIVIDEADKMFEPEISNSGTDYSMIIQNNLLKILDGDTLTFTVQAKATDRTFTVDCKRVSVVFLGAFEMLMDKLSSNSQNARKSIGFGANITPQTLTHRNVTIDDLIRYGNIRREIAGRLQSVTVLDPVDAQGFRHILDTPSMSPINSLSREYDCNILVDEHLKDLLCTEASEQRLGVRYINNQLRMLVEDALYKNPEEHTLLLTRNPLTG